MHFGTISNQVCHSYALTQICSNLIKITLSTSPTCDCMVEDHVNSSWLALPHVELGLLNTTLWSQSATRASAASAASAVGLWVWGSRWNSCALKWFEVNIWMSQRHHCSRISLWKPYFAAHAGHTSSKSPQIYGRFKKGSWTTSLLSVLSENNLAGCCGWVQLGGVMRLAECNSQTKPPGQVWRFGSDPSVCEILDTVISININ